MKYILILIFSCSILYGQGIRSLNGSLANSQRIVVDTTATSNTLTTSSGVHTIGLTFPRIGFLDRANTFRNRQTFDSVAVTGAVTFSGISSDSTTVPSGGIYFRASDGILRRKY